jgi:hypothetical protein
MADKGCSNATLKGTYIYSENGWQIDGEVRKPFSFSGIETYNGDGPVSGIFSGSIDGVVSRNVAYTGTGTIHENCTGNQTFTDESNFVTHYDIFVSPTGDEFTFTQTDPGAVSSGVERRVKRRTVTLEGEP